MRKNSIVKRAHHKLNKRIKRKRDSFEIEGYQFGSTNQSKLLFWVLFSPFWWWFMPKCIRKLNKAQTHSALERWSCLEKITGCYDFWKWKFISPPTFGNSFCGKFAFAKTLEIKFKELFSPYFFKTWPKNTHTDSQI